MVPAGGAALDQIVFRWDTGAGAGRGGASGATGGGTTGPGPVAWSPGAEAAEGDLGRAAALLRPTGGDSAPALVRLRYGDGVLLAHRSPWRDADGRTGTLCHALVGPADLLDPATCLGLHGWCWQGSRLPPDVRGPLPPVPGAALRPTAEEGRLLLARTVSRARDELTGAVAEFLRDPGARFTLLDPSGGETACRVLWGLYGIFGDHAGDGWTFATHGTAEPDDLRFVFLGRWAGRPPGGGPRRRTDPLERRADRAEEVARRLVSHHLRDLGEDGRPGRRVSAALGSAAGRASRPLLEAAEHALALLADGDRPAARPAHPPARDRPPVAAGAGPEPPAAPEWPVPRRGARRWRRTGGSRGGRPGRLLAAVARPYDPADPHAPGEPLPREVLGGAPDADLLRALRQPVHYDVLTQLVEEAVERWPAWSRETRTQLCVVLLDQGLFLTDRAVDLGDPDGGVRAANAASLYRWAVRPLLGDPRISDRLAVLLPRLSTGPHRAAQAAVRRIVESDEPRLPEAAWQALLMAAYTAGPPAASQSPAPPPAPTPVSASRPPVPTPAPAPAPVSPSQPPPAPVPPTPAPEPPPAPVPPTPATPAPAPEPPEPVPAPQARPRESEGTAPASAAPAGRREGSEDQPGVQDGRFVLAGLGAALVILLVLLFALLMAN
ncbi:hypothetical protein ACIRD2_32430 [Streptomyces sp. NPDC093595]|uniref:hypothetical protein n=1 Tax=Streptomyces sp. NPDC093595 TaxID=3366045 RepID=UPI00381ABB54